MLLSHSHLLSSFCTRVLVSRFFSSVSASETARNKWHLGGVPRPRSILEDDDAEVDLSEDNDLVNGKRQNTFPPHLRKPSNKPTPPEWKAHRYVLKKDFPEGWAPPRKLSREAMDGLRQMHNLDPEKFSTPLLAEKFRISPEAVRRILKSRWEPPMEKRVKLLERERAEKAAYKSLNRVKERIEARQLQDMKMQVKRRGRDDDSSESTKGLHSGDKFTFE